MEFEMPRRIDKEKSPVIDPIENVHDVHLTVGEQLYDRGMEYQCKTCNKRFQDKYKLEVHQSLHVNIKKFNCISCGEQFLELNGLKSHLISHLDDNIKLFENKFIQECYNIGDCNSNLWYAH